MNDLVSISTSSAQVQKVQTYCDPNARRRHSGGFIGSSLVLFGGFDGNYFDDLFYINLYETGSGKSNKNQQEQMPENYDEFIFDIDGKSYYIFASLIGKYFKS